MSVQKKKGGRIPALRKKVGEPSPKPFTVDSSGPLPQQNENWVEEAKKNIQQLTWKNLKTFKKEKLNENEELYEKYYSVVKNPLYFETIEKKLNMKPVPYKTYKEFVEQVNQIFKQEENVHSKYPTEFTLRWEDVKSIRNYFKLITDPLIKRNFGNYAIEETNIEKK